MRESIVWILVILTLGWFAMGCVNTDTRQGGAAWAIAGARTNCAGRDFCRKQVEDLDRRYHELRSEGVHEDSERWWGIVSAAEALSQRIHEETSEETCCEL